MIKKSIFKLKNYKVPKTAYIHFKTSWDECKLLIGYHIKIPFRLRSEIQNVIFLSFFFVLIKGDVSMHCEKEIIC